MAWVQTARPPVDSAVAEVARAPAELPDISWSHPEVSIRAAGYGVAAVRDEMSLRAVLSGLEVPAGLPAHVPGPWLAWTAGDRHFLAAFGDGAQRRLDAARARLDEVRPAPRPAAASVRRIANAGERARWTALVTRALAAIRAGALDKVVLARAIDMEAEAPLDPAVLLGALESRYPSCRGFLIRGRDAVFLGATPELLCRIERDQVQADALAGSAPPEQAEALPGNGRMRWRASRITCTVRPSPGSGLSRTSRTSIRPSWRGSRRDAASPTWRPRSIRRPRWAASRRPRPCAFWRNTSAWTADSTRA